MCDHMIPLCTCMQLCSKCCRELHLIGWFHFVVSLVQVLRMATLFSGSGLIACFIISHLHFPPSEDLGLPKAWPESCVRLRGQKRCRGRLQWPPNWDFWAKFLPDCPFFWYDPGYAVKVQLLWSQTSKTWLSPLVWANSAYTADLPARDVEDGDDEVLLISSPSWLFTSYLEFFPPVLARSLWSSVGWSLFRPRSHPTGCYLLSSFLSL